MEEKLRSEKADSNFITAIIIDEIKQEIKLIIPLTPRDEPLASACRQPDLPLRSMVNDTGESAPCLPEVLVIMNLTRGLSLK
jgi:hypothetical protein